MNESNMSGHISVYKITDMWRFVWVINITTLASSKLTNHQRRVVWSLVIALG